MSESFDSAVSVRERITPTEEHVARAIAGVRYSHIGGADSVWLGRHPAWLYCIFEARAAIKAYAEAIRGWSVE